MNWLIPHLITVLSLGVGGWSCGVELTIILGVYHGRCRCRPRRASRRLSVVCSMSFWDIIGLNHGR